MNPMTPEQNEHLNIVLMQILLGATSACFYSLRNNGNPLTALLYLFYWPIQIVEILYVLAVVFYEDRLKKYQATLDEYFDSNESKKPIQPNHLYFNIITGLLLISGSSWTVCYFRQMLPISNLSVVIVYPFEFLCVSAWVYHQIKMYAPGISENKNNEYYGNWDY